MELAVLFGEEYAACLSCLVLLDPAEGSACVTTFSQSEELNFALTEIQGDNNLVIRMCSMHYKKKGLL